MGFEPTKLMHWCLKPTPLTARAFQQKSVIRHTFYLTFSCFCFFSYFFLLFSCFMFYLSVVVAPVTHSYRQTPAASRRDPFPPSTLCCWEALPRSFLIVVVALAVLAVNGLCLNIGCTTLSTASLRLVDPTLRALPEPRVVIDDLHDLAGLQAVTHSSPDGAGVGVEVNEDAPVLGAVGTRARYHVNAVDAIVAEEFRENIPNAVGRDVVEDAGDADRGAVVEK